MKKMLRAAIPLALIIIIAACFLLFSEHTYQPATQAVFRQGDYTDYYYLALDETEKKAYTAVKESISSFPKEILTPSLTEDQLNRVLNALICDDPMLFMFNTCTLDITGATALFRPDYDMSLEEYTRYVQDIEAVLTQALAFAPQGDEFEKELFCHDYIVNSCEYSDTELIPEGNVVGALIEGKAKCSGYAKAFKLLLSRLGIESVLVSGTATDYSGAAQSHMWNAVRIDNSWCYTDPTWNDPITDSDDKSCRHVFFNMNEEMLRRTHSNFDFNYDCDSSSLYYYIRYNAYFDSCDSSRHPQMAAIIAAVADRGEAKAEFMFTDKETALQAFTCLFENESIYRILETANLSSEKNLATNRLEYTFSEDENLITVYFSVKE